MKKILRVMDGSGDTAIEFDTEDAAATAAARAEFEALMRRTAFAVAVNRGEGKPDELVRGFDALEAENVLVKAVVSG